MSERIGWMKDCDFDEAIGNARYVTPKIYASEKELLDDNPEMRNDPECTVYAIRVRVVEIED